MRGNERRPWAVTARGEGRKGVDGEVDARSNVGERASGGGVRHRFHHVVVFVWVLTAETPAVSFTTVLTRVARDCVVR